MNAFILRLKADRRYLNSTFTNLVNKSKDYQFLYNNMIVFFQLYKIHQFLYWWDLIKLSERYPLT